MWAALLGGPLAGGILFCANFVRTGKKITAILILVVSAALSVAYYSTFIIKSFGIYTFLFTLGYLYVTNLLNVKFTAPEILRHKNLNGGFVSGFVVAVIVIPVMILNLILFDPASVLSLLRDYLLF